MTTIKEIGERALLELFRELVDQGELPFNDDAVAYNLPDGRLLIVNIDTLVQSTDIPNGMTPFQIGAKAATMAISDLAAKGVQPLFTIASGSFPNSYNVDDIYNIVKGISQTTHHAGAKYLGGDTNESNEIVLSVVSIGITSKERLIKRHGTQSGDIVCTTGNFGLTGAGFKVFIAGYSATKKQKQVFHTAIYTPQARLREGLFLSEFGNISACIDSSDGLAWSLKELIRNNPKIGINLKTIPIDPLVREFSNDHQIEVEELALYGGEEFELIFAINKKYLGELIESALSKKIIFYPIGEITTDYPEAIYYHKDNQIVKVLEKGYEHFKK